MNELPDCDLEHITAGLVKGGKVPAVTVDNINLHLPKLPFMGGQQQQQQ